MQFYTMHRIRTFPIFFLKILLYCQKLLKKSDIIFRCSYGVRFFIKKWFLTLHCAVWIKDWLSLRYVPWFMFDIKSVCPLLRPIMTLALTFINGISSNSCSVFLFAMVFKVMVPLWNIQCSNLQRNTVKSRIQVLMYITCRNE